MNAISHKGGTPFAHRPIVQLIYGGGIGLILPWPSGILYANQVGGHGCLHPEVEGIYMPLFPEGSRMEQALDAHFTGPKWQGWCSEGLDEETACHVDALLAESERTKGIRVHRNHLEDSCEAWVYVTIPDSRSQPAFSPFKGFKEATAILTWSNSD